MSRSRMTSDGRAVIPTRSAAYSSPEVLRERSAGGVRIRLERRSQLGGPPLLLHIAEYRVDGGQVMRCSAISVPHHGMEEADPLQLAAAIAQDEVRLLRIAQMDIDGVDHPGALQARRPADRS
jgi:hypothetical protein